MTSSLKLPLRVQTASGGLAVEIRDADNQFVLLTYSLEGAEALVAAVNQQDKDPKLWQPIETAPKGEMVLLYNGIRQVGDWGWYDFYNAPKFTPLDAAS